MAIVRRRLIFWLVKAYIKKWRKTVLLCFGIGIIVFFLLRSYAGNIFGKIHSGQQQIIGVVGDYTVDSLPTTILSDISRGLTKLGKDGKPEPDLATSWEIRDSGKTYVFNLNKNNYFSDGTRVFASNIDYRFSDATVTNQDKLTLIYKLKDNYAPFLVKVSKPIFKNGLVGTGNYVLKKIQLNGNFVKTLTMTLVKDQAVVKTYQFYSTVDSLKMAYVMGEISEISGVSDLRFKNKDFSTFPNSRIKQTTNYNKLVTLFYNNQDKVLSDKRIREALTYGLPDSFLDGERTYFPYSLSSWAYDDTLLAHKEDIQHAQVLLDASTTATSGAVLTLEIQMLPKYQKTAEEIKKAWERLGIKITTKSVSIVPTNFQIFLGDFNIPFDPDQYSLWHSSQENNITRYDNKRIDKLLEDGRKILDLEERKKIYGDFQKYLLADAPASFLYYPYEYTVTRK